MPKSTPVLMSKPLPVIVTCNNEETITQRKTSVCSMGAQILTAAGVLKKNAHG